VEIAVADRGTGLSQQVEGQLFSPFFTTKADGMGIGLNICRSIVEYHDGRLFFQNNADRGSTFFFSLPPLTQRSA
jgi:signal transduction histidine kinase